MIAQTACPSCGAANRVATGHPAHTAKCGRCSAKLSLEAPIEVDDNALARQLEATKGLVLVDVWAPWCGPCRAMAPQFAAAAQALAGEARLLKLNADTSETVRHLGVSGIPALLLFKDGRIVDRLAGLMQSDSLVQWVRAHQGASASTPN